MPIFAQFAYTLRFSQGVYSRPIYGTPSVLFLAAGNKHCAALVFLQGKFSSLSNNAHVCKFQIKARSPVDTSTNKATGQCAQGM